MQIQFSNCRVSLKKRNGEQNGKRIPQASKNTGIGEQGGSGPIFSFCSPFLLFYSIIPSQQITTEQKNKVTSIGFYLQHKMPSLHSTKPLTSNNENLGTILCKHILHVWCVIPFQLQRVEYITALFHRSKRDAAQDFIM